MRLWGYDYWPVFLLGTVAWLALFFGVPEIYAAITNPGDTLSDYSWHELHVGHIFANVPTFAWYCSLITWLMFVCTFVPIITIHIWWKGP